MAQAPPCRGKSRTVSIGTVSAGTAHTPSASPGSGRSPTTAITIGSAGIILRSSAACSVPRYLPRRGGFMHAKAEVAGLAQARDYPVRMSKETLGQSSHEQVVFCHDAPTGLRAIIAIYSTALGPSLGGTRFYPYASDEAALADVLNLARAMAY